MGMNTKTQTITLPAPLHEVLHALSELSYPMECHITNEGCAEWAIKRNVTVPALQSLTITMCNPAEWVWLVQHANEMCKLNPDTRGKPQLTIQAESVQRVPKVWPATAEDFPARDTLQTAGALKNELKRLVDTVIDPAGLALLARSIFGQEQDPHAALETLAGAIRAAVHDIATADATVNHARNQRRQQDAPLHDAARKAQRDLLQAVAYLERQIEHRPREHAEKLKALRAAAGLTEAEALRAVPAPDVGALVAELADARVRLQDVALYLEDTDHHTPPVWLKLEGAAQ